MKPANEKSVVGHGRSNRSATDFSFAGGTPKLFIFDLDGTLAESKQPISPAMAALLAQLTARAHVAVVSGGALKQFLTQVVERLPASGELSHLHLLPTSGASLYDHENGGWKKIYEERLTEKEARHIEATMKEVGEATGLITFAAPSWGERIEYRGSQVTLSALGQQAPLLMKKEWDRDHAKRHALQAALATRLGDFSVSLGGSTSIDVTKKGVDKAYGIHRLCERLGIEETDAVYVGDELGSGGNDEAVYKTAVKAVRVANPAETKRFIEAFLSRTL